MTHGDTSGRYGNRQKAAKNEKIPDFGWYYGMGKLGGGSRTTQSKALADFEAAASASSATPGFLEKQHEARCPPLEFSTARLDSATTEA